MNEREDEETEGLGGMVNFFVAFHHGLRLLGPRLPAASATPAVQLPLTGRPLNG